MGGGQYSGGSISGVKGQYSGSDESGSYVASGEYSDKGSNKYFGAAAGFNGAVPSSTPYAGSSGQYDAGKYSVGSGEYVESGQYSPIPVVSTTISPFLSTQAGQYSSNGLTYSGPTAAPAFVSGKSTAYNGFGSTGTPITVASTTASPYSAGIVTATTPGYASVGGEYSGVSLSGEKFGVDGESGHIHSPSSNVHPGFEQYTGGFADLALRVNGLQPSLSENVDGSGYSTSGKVFFSPTPTPGGFSSYTPSSYSTPNPFYGSSTSLPGVFSSIYPGKSLFVSTPAPVAYSSFSPAKSTPYTTSSEYVSSYNTPKPVSYSGASYSSTPAPAPYSPSVVKYSPTPVPYSPTPAPYSPSVVKYSPTPAPYSPTPDSYSPSVVKYSPTPAPYSPTPAPYYPSPAPYSPSIVKYSPTPAPYSPTAAPYSPSVVKYSPTPAPYSPSVEKYSPSPAPYFPSPSSYSSFGEKYSASYSPSPAPYSPSVVSYSTTAAPPVSYPSYSGSYSAKLAPHYPSYSPSSPASGSYSPTPAPYSPSSGPTFVSYSSQKPVTPSPVVYAPSSTLSPVVSYSTPAPKNYYPTSTPAPIVYYTAPPVYSGSLTGFPQHSQYSGQSEYISSYSGPSFGQGYVAGDFKQNAQSGSSYSADSSAYSAGGGKVQYGTKLPVSYSTTEKGSYASSTAAPIAYSTTTAPVNTYSVGSNGYSGSDYSSNTFSGAQNYVNRNLGYGSQSYSGEDYLPPLASVPAYDLKKPCEHPIPAAPSQTFHSSGYEQVKYQAPYVFETSSPAPAYNPQSLHVNPIVVHPLPEVSYNKDYFYSTVLPSYSTPAPIVYSTTPAYYSTASPVQYSTPIRSYVSSTPAPPVAEYQYVSSYSTPKPFVSTTASPIHESSYVSTYSTPKPVSYSSTPVSTTSRPIVNYAFGSSYSPAPIVSTTAAPFVYSTPAQSATYESSNVYPTGPSVPLSYTSFSSPPVVYGPGNLQPIKSYQSTGSYDVQSYTATPKPCASNSLDIADQSKAGASSLPDGTYVVGIKHQDKVVIVSRLSDFNPLLVEKLGATCDCHSQSQPIKVVRRRKILRSTTASPSEDLGSSGQYNSNSIHSYSAHKIETASAGVDVVSYNTKEEAEKSEQFHAVPKATKKLFSARKSAVTSTTEKSYDETEDEHSHDGDNLSITEFGTIECMRAGLFRHPKKCNKFYQCNWDEWKKKFVLHEFKCPIHLAYDSNIGACNWPSKGPACSNDNLLV